jgi:hypothetical protein
VLKTLFANIRDFLLKHQAAVRWPRQRLPYKAAALLQTPPMCELLSTTRRWLSAHVFDSANERRTLGPVSFGAVAFSAADIEAFAGSPLAASHFVEVKPKPPLGAAGAAWESLLPNVESHGAADNPMAAAMLARLRDDLAQYAQVAQQGSVTQLRKVSPAEAAAIVDKPDGPAARAAQQANHPHSRSAAVPPCRRAAVPPCRRAAASLVSGRLVARVPACRWLAYPT